MILFSVREGELIDIDGGPDKGGVTIEVASIHGHHTILSFTSNLSGRVRRRDTKVEHLTKKEGVPS